MAEHAVVRRNMPPEGTVYEYGTKPPYTVGMWFVECSEHGPLRTDQSYGWYHHEVSAQRIADLHNQIEHGGERNA